MTLEASFDSLVLRLQVLRDALSSLRIMVGEDQPLTGGVVLVDNVSNTLEDLWTSLEGADNASGEGRQAVNYPTDLQSARRSLVRCQQFFNDVSYRLTSDLLSYERLAELTTFGRERGGEWRGWADSVKKALERCWQPAFDVNQALFLCWQEIAERAGMNAVSVNATNIGQMIEGVENKERVDVGVP
jgi:hypothetical protein